MERHVSWHKYDDPYLSNTKMPLGPTYRCHWHWEHTRAVMMNESENQIGTTSLEMCVFLFFCLFIYFFFFWGGGGEGFVLIQHNGALLSVQLIPLIKMRLLLFLVMAWWRHVNDWRLGKKSRNHKRYKPEVACLISF